MSKGTPLLSPAKAVPPPVAIAFVCVGLVMVGGVVWVWLLKRDR